MLPSSDNTEIITAQKIIGFTVEDILLSGKNCSITAVIIIKVKIEIII